MENFKAGFYRATCQTGIQYMGTSYDREETDTEVYSASFTVDDLLRLSEYQNVVSYLTADDEDLWESLNEELRINL